MEIISHHGDPDLAEVFVARFRKDDRFLAEFVDARDPDQPKDKKWVVIISTQFGCPISCQMCDAGGSYHGDLLAEEMFAQIDAVVARHHAERIRCADKFKIQFARMGEPSLNDAVLDVLAELPSRYNTRGLIPCIATVGPKSARAWFEKLLELRHSTYTGRQFQLQLSINSTDEGVRDRLMPCKKFSLMELAGYASLFHRADSGRKVSLNFAVMKGVPVDHAVISNLFDPACTCIKLTPLNPTMRSHETGLDTALPPEQPAEVERLCSELTGRGFDVIVSIGDLRENQIGSNCGMAVRKIQNKISPSS